MMNMRLKRIKKELSTKELKNPLYPDYLTSPLLGNHYVKEVLLKNIQIPKDFSSCPVVSY